MFTPRASLGKSQKLGGNEYRFGLQRQSNNDVQPFGHVSQSDTRTGIARTSYSFGTSREAMKKLHIDRIRADIEKGLSTPAPVTYQLNATKFVSLDTSKSPRIKMRYGETDRKLRR